MSMCWYSSAASSQRSCSHGCIIEGRAMPKLLSEGCPSILIRQRWEGLQVVRDGIVLNETC
eukprot:763079-Hanusia_phi.AAC.2